MSNSGHRQSEIERMRQDMERRELREPWPDTGCKCTLTQRLVRDGCPKCQPVSSGGTEHE